MKKWSECIKRALRTFIEAAAAYLAAHIVLAVSTGGEDLSVMRTALMGLAVSSVAAGLAAVLNMPKKAAEAEDAAAGGGTAGVGQTAGDDADAGFETDSRISDAAPGAETAGLGSTPYISHEPGDAASGTAVGENMADGAGNKGIL